MYFYLWQQRLHYSGQHLLMGMHLLRFLSLLKAAKVKGQSSLLNWLKDIVNHFWWCCKMANTTEMFLVREIIFIPNVAINLHELVV